MKFDFRESRIISVKISPNVTTVRDRAARRPCGATTVRRDDRAAVGWAWTGRNLILDEALGKGRGRLIVVCIWEDAGQIVDKCLCNSGNREKCIGCKSLKSTLIVDRMLQVQT